MTQAVHEALLGERIVRQSSVTPGFEELAGVLLVDPAGRGNLELAHRAAGKPPARPRTASGLRRWRIPGTRCG